MMNDYVTAIPSQTHFIKTIVEHVTLRDQFAMAALTGILSDPECGAWGKIVEDAYTMADLMLEARKEKK
jgi:hypothetical protein